MRIPGQGDLSQLFHEDVFYSLNIKVFIYRIMMASAIKYVVELMDQ